MCLKISSRDILCLKLSSKFIESYIMCLKLSSKSIEICYVSQIE